MDRKGKLWYMIGDSEWIEARYTKDLEEQSNTKTAQEQVRKTATKKKIKNLSLRLKLRR